MASIDVTGFIRRGRAGSARRRLSQEVRAWLDAVHAVLEGHVPWPATGIPVGSARGRVEFPVIRIPQRVSASVLINATPEVVWEHICAPESMVRDEPTTLYAGYVPGSPHREAGEMQYVVHQEPDGRLTGDVIVVEDIADQRRALVRQVGFPYSQIDHLVTAEGNGTRLQLTSIVSADVLQDRGKLARHMSSQANKFKKHIEQPGR